MWTNFLFLTVCWTNYFSLHFDKQSLFFFKKPVAPVHTRIIWSAVFKLFSPGLDRAGAESLYKTGRHLSLKCPEGFVDSRHSIQYGSLGMSPTSCVMAALPSGTYIPAPRELRPVNQWGAPPTAGSSCRPWCLLPRHLPVWRSGYGPDAKQEKARHYVTYTYFSTLFSQIAIVIVLVTKSHRDRSTWLRWLESSLLCVCMCVCVCVCVCENAPYRVFHVCLLLQIPPLTLRCRPQGHSTCSPRPCVGRPLKLIEKLLHVSNNYMLVY